MKASVIIRCRNEYPIILCTINSLVADLEHGNIPYEVIVVTNCSEDSTADVLEDKYRRWKKAGLLKVIRYDEKPSTWGAINVGYQASVGDVILIADAHISVAIGTLPHLVKNALELGGIWHAPVQIWGDTDDIKNYGYDLKLADRFWGDPCRWRPPPGPDLQRDVWKIPMAGACMIAMKREEIEELSLPENRGPYSMHFKAYGGGEPYLDLKWWMLGSSVNMIGTGLVRHAFGLNASWERVTKDRRPRNTVLRRDGAFVHKLKAGEEYLAYRAGYSVSNTEMNYNFLLAAYILGGDEWLAHVAGSFRRDHGLKAATDEMLSSVMADGKEEHEWILSHLKISLNDLINSPPWESCTMHDHKKQIPDKNQLACKTLQ